jgi:type I restriction enzyme S subunit
VSEWFGTSAFPVRRFGHVFSVTLGKMLQPEPSSAGDVLAPYLKAASLGTGEAVLREGDDMWASPMDMNRYGVRSGDLMVVEGGDVGRCAIYDGPPAIFQNSLHRVRSTPDTDVRFGQYLLTALRDSGYLDVLCSVATIRHLTLEKLRELTVPLPSLNDQQRIADFLDQHVAGIDAAVAGRQRQLELIEQRRVIATLDALPAGPLGPMRRLLDEAVVGIVVQPSKYYTDDDGVPALRGLDVREGRIAPDGHVRLTAEGHAAHPRSRLRRGDVVVVRTGDAGMAAEVPSWAEDWNCIDLVIARAANGVSPAYVEAVINAARLADGIGEASTGSIQQHFGVNALLEYSVPLVDLEEQERTASRVRYLRKEAESASDLVRASRLALSELRAVLIADAVTGRLAVPASARRDVVA